MAMVMMMVVAMAMVFHPLLYDENDVDDG